MENWIINFMEQFGYLGTFLMILLENVFPPIPSEVILTFGGFMTTNTDMTVIGVVTSATAGSVAGAAILYGIGRLLNVNKLEKIISCFGNILRVKVSDIQKANSWFARYGYKAIFFCRMIPLVRSLISIPAGMENMKFNLFLLYTTAGTLIWNIVLVSAGAILGESWQSVLDFMSVYSSITYTILGLTFFVFCVLWFLKRKRNLKIS
ncbi:DedA family protein [Clostridium magnum]|uniref:TVP38/TMEM64 family inner membrane protein YdjZ n=1 Tax=Clostridium magnum DSM 2767 TaxID=1121326 RepID=A0A162R1I5_9CLOT|nr:DedA family protein [Clostridium magnum]KZL89284.1 TVP38/TMEM64 family inner membrane protein YdjZ [Clostridium magnum DSM 2767]SHI96009.1 membrane protein DedA, SNARE-associated domain [Clostridium magnum DSM 2767]